MAMKRYYDDRMVQEMAEDLSSKLVLEPATPDAYLNLARKMYAMGWRKEEGK